MKRMLLTAVLLLGVVGCTQGRFDSHKGFHVVSEPEGYCVVLEQVTGDATYVVKNIKSPKDAQGLADRLNQVVDPYRPEDLRYRP